MGVGGAGLKEPGEGRRAQAVSGQQGAPELFTKLGGHSGETRDSGKGRVDSESGGRMARTEDHSCQGNSHSDWPGLLFARRFLEGWGSAQECLPCLTLTESSDAVFRSSLGPGSSRVQMASLHH